jgi:hypothetical protein
MRSATGLCNEADGGVSLSSVCLDSWYGCDIFVVIISNCVRCPPQTNGRSEQTRSCCHAYPVSFRASRAIT